MQHLIRFFLPNLSFTIQGEKVHSQTSYRGIPMISIMLDWIWLLLTCTGGSGFFLSIFCSILIFWFRASCSWILTCFCSSSSLMKSLGWFNFWYSSSSFFFSSCSIYCRSTLSSFQLCIGGNQSNSNNNRLLFYAIDSASLLMIPLVVLVVLAASVAVIFSVLVPAFGAIWPSIIDTPIVAPFSTAPFVIPLSRWPTTILVKSTTLMGGFVLGPASAFWSRTH